ncbi:MAG: EF-hand domain-containing protein [Thiobacillus sp.]|nr:EF-hand domain-containing protein [Thiobacillus sp.]
MISGISSSYTSQLASTLFSKLDSKNQGYFDKLDLESALSGVSSLSDTEDTLSIDEVFGQLDGDSDGKVTQDELTSSLQKLADELNSQYNGMRMGRMGGMGGLPPPPPAGGAADEGFTLDELQSQLDEIGSTDSERSGLISEIVDNFESADSDGNGKVSFAEAMAFDQASKSSATGTADTSTADTSTSGTATSGSQTANDVNLLRMVMELMRAYGPEAFQASLGGFSTTA